MRHVDRLKDWSAILVTAVIVVLIAVAAVSWAARQPDGPGSDPDEPNPPGYGVHG